jgi:hypothetical protein
MNHPESVPIVINPEGLKGWLPVDAVIASGRPAIEWMDLRDVEFSEPFFNETLARVGAGDEVRERVLTDLDALLQFEKISGSIQPCGFIFHGSRCGSTLLANACRALNGSIVIAEAPVIDKVVSRFFTDAAPDSPKEMLYMVLLKAAINALGQRRNGNERRYFVKFACTSTLQITRIRRIWPNTPFVFLYRDPIEVIVSNLNSIPEWMRPESNPATAAAIVGIDEDRISSLSPEEFCARALGRFFSEAEANSNAQTIFLNYNQLSFENLVEIISFFGVEASPAECDAIKQESRLYSKDVTRSQTFQADSIIKRDLATEYVLAMAEKWAQGPYERLNAHATSIAV